MERAKTSILSGQANNLGCDTSVPWMTISGRQIDNCRQVHVFRSRPRWASQSPSDRRHKKIAATASPAAFSWRRPNYEALPTDKARLGPLNFLEVVFRTWTASAESLWKDSAPGEIRTSDLLVRRAILHYPPSIAEPRRATKRSKSSRAVRVVWLLAGSGLRTESAQEGLVGGRRYFG